MPANPIDITNLVNTGGTIALLVIVFWLFLKGEMVPKEVSRQLVEANRAAITSADAATRAIEAFAEEQKRTFTELIAANKQVCQSLDKLLEQNQRLQELSERIDRLEDTRRAQ